MRGLICFFSGVRLIMQPGLRQYIVVPLLINSVLFSLAGWFLWIYLSMLVDDFLPSWLAWLAWLVIPIVALSMMSAVFFFFTLVANIIAAPFYSQLAKGVESHLRGEPMQEIFSGNFLKQLMLSIRSELKKISYYLVRAIPLILLTFVPGINIVAVGLWFLFSAWFLTFEYAAYSFDNHNVLFNEQKERLNQQRINTVTFGGLSLFATGIPIVNMFAPAVSVAGATKMVYEGKWL